MYITCFSSPPLVRKRQVRLTVATGTTKFMYLQIQRQHLIPIDAEYDDFQTRFGFKQWLFGVLYLSVISQGSTVYIPQIVYRGSSPRKTLT